MYTEKLVVITIVLLFIEQITGYSKVHCHKDQRQSCNFIQSNHYNNVYLPNELATYDKYRI